MTNALGILLLEDDPYDAVLIEETLRTSEIDCNVTRVDSRAAFVAELARDCYVLILADYSLPGFDGLTALELARQTCPQIPFIFVSGSLGEEIAIEALKVGATDYVLKARLARIVPSVRRALREANERAELNRVQQALRRSEAYLAEAQHLSRTGSFGWVTNRREMTWSLETYRIFGYPAGTKVSTEHVVERTHPDDRPLLVEQIDKLTRGVSSIDFEHRLLMPDETVKHLRIVGHCLSDLSGYDELVGAVTDVTDRKQAEAARLEERTRIAGDLHDTLLQSMQGLLLLLSTAESHLPDRPVEAHRVLHRAIERAQTALLEGRDAVFQLRAAPSEDLESLIRGIDRRLAGDEESSVSRKRPELTVSRHGAAFSLPSTVQNEVNMIALEAVRNSFRHAEAARIEVEITYAESHLEVYVRDDGRGMSSANLADLRPAGRWGMAGMRERASRIGAQLRIDSHLGVGTEIRLSLRRTEPGEHHFSPPGARRFPDNFAELPAQMGLVGQATINRNIGK